MVYFLIFLAGVLIGFRLGFWYLKVQVRKDRFREKYFML